MPDTPPPPQPPHKDTVIITRVDKSLKDEAQQAAKPYGGLSAVIRAMLRVLVSGERNFDINQLAKENTQAPKRPRKPKPAKPTPAPTKPAPATPTTKKRATK